MNLELQRTSSHLILLAPPRTTPVNVKSTWRSQLIPRSFQFALLVDHLDTDRPHVNNAGNHIMKRSTERNARRTTIGRNSKGERRAYEERDRDRDTESDKPMWSEVFPCCVSADGVAMFRPCSYHVGLHAVLHTATSHIHTCPANRESENESPCMDRSLQKMNRPDTSRDTVQVSFGRTAQHDKKLLDVQTPSLQTKWLVARN